ncbi:MAG TPA: outer membrane beta-barrel protein, partial [Sphingomicrobium sp.]|nr:outer membrane beta-barrel protein [Sphingomicrobium sp.]
MRRYLLAAVAVAALSSPALARDGSAYFGIEGGIMFPRDMDGDGFVDFTSTPATPVGPADFVGVGSFDAELKRGYDIDAIAGFDLGAFRLELEGGYKRAKRDGFDPSAAFLTQLNAGLNRPSAAPDPGAPGAPALTTNDFSGLDGKVAIKSLMVNALADFGNDDGMSFYAGAGFGRAWGRALDDGDKAWAWQLIAGARMAISDNIDAGLKYRYFRTGRMNFQGGPISYGGNPNFISTGLNQTTVATVTPVFN